MSKDNLRLFKYLGLIFIAELLIHKLPHDSYSIIQYIIRPIKIGNGALYLSGLFPLILIIIVIKDIFRQERYANRSRIGIIILIFVIIMPIMKWTLDFTRTNYHWIMRDGLSAVDIKESNINLERSNDSITIKVKLELIDYSRGQNEFKIRVYLPKSLSEYTGKEFYELKDNYRTNGNQSILKIDEEIVVIVDNVDAQEKMFNSKWYWEVTKYELFNENEIVDIINHGRY